MHHEVAVTFNQQLIHEAIDAADDREVDELDFGVIGFNAATLVTRYNAIESCMAGLTPERVLGHKLFAVVAPCMNNYMVALRFEDAAATQSALDVTIDYVFTLRMRPSKVLLRLLFAPDRATRYVLVNRRS